MQSCSIAKRAEMSKSFGAKNKKTCKKSKKGVDNSHSFCYNIRATSGERKAVPQRNGGIAQLARAFGSYPTGRWFKSDFRYHKLFRCLFVGTLSGPLVKRLRHGPFTAVTWVRFPYGSPKRRGNFRQKIVSSFVLLSFHSSLFSLRRKDKREEYWQKFKPRQNAKNADAAKRRFSQWKAKR